MSMNQGKLKVVKQEMARLDIDILAIGELKCTRMGEFNSNDLGTSPLQEHLIKVRSLAIIGEYKLVYVKVVNC